MKSTLIVLVFTIVYTLLFGGYYLITQNYEFLFYVAIILFLTGFMIYLHKRFTFHPLVLWGLSIWGIIHMAGGSLMINGHVLYAQMLWTIFPSQEILKYDQFAHFYFYFFAVIFVYEIAKNYVSAKINKVIFYCMLLFIAMGIGALNEILEFIAVLTIPDTGVGGYYNTLWDLVFNTFGALFGILFIHVFYQKKGGK